MRACRMSADFCSSAVNTADAHANNWGHIWRLCACGATYEIHLSPLFIKSPFIAQWDFFQSSITWQSQRMSVVFNLRQSEPQSENINRNKGSWRQMEMYLISGRTRRTSSVFPPREPLPPTPAPVTPRRSDSGLPGNRRNKRKTVSLYKSLVGFRKNYGLKYITVCTDHCQWEFHWFYKSLSTGLRQNCSTCEKICSKPFVAPVW